MKAYKNKGYQTDRPATPEELQKAEFLELVEKTKEERTANEKNRESTPQAIDKALEQEAAMFDILSDERTQKSFRDAGYVLNVEKDNKEKIVKVELIDKDGKIRFYSDVRGLKEAELLKKKDFLN